MPVPASPAISPADGFNLQLLDVLPEDRLIVALASPAHNWFAGTFTHLPVSRPVTLGLSMQGNDTERNPADVRKWQGLAPVMTYADPLAYRSYEWFVKDAHGQWLSGDPLKTGTARTAGHGKLPLQQAVPAHLAEQFLTADGRYWLPWREVDGAEALPNLNSFRITHTFNAPSATVAMRVPCTYTYLQAFIARVQAAKLPWATVEEIGRTPENRALQVIKVEEPARPKNAPPAKTILFIAREHATEHASSWALLGALHAVLPDTPAAHALRKDTTWLFIPIQDPDGSANSVFDRLTEMFALPSQVRAVMPEVRAYAEYFTQYLYSGRSLDVVVSLHNVEAREAEHVVCPFINRRHVEYAQDFNRIFFASLAQQGFRTGNPDKPWDYGFCPSRLFGWCAEQFGTFDLTFEVNDRYPAQRLSLPQLQEIGATLAQSLATWTAGPQGERMLARTRQLATLKRLERVMHYHRAGYTQAHRTDYDLYTKGF